MPLQIQVEETIQTIGVTVCDFDGVIVRGSEELKDWAWTQIFTDPKNLAVNKKWQKYFANGAGDRYDILRKAIAEIGFEEASKKTIKRYADKFDNFVQQGILDIGVHKDDMRALEFLSSKSKLFINSATPEDSMLQTVKNLGIEKLFLHVYGMPTTKLENLDKVRLFTGVSISEIIFIGDNNGDREAASTFGCPFIGIKTKQNGWKEKGDDFALVDNLSCVPKVFI